MFIRCFWSCRHWWIICYLHSWFAKIMPSTNYCSFVYKIWMLNLATAWNTIRFILVIRSLTIHHYMLFSVCEVLLCTCTCGCTHIMHVHMFMYISNPIWGLAIDFCEVTMNISILFTHCCFGSSTLTNFQSGMPLRRMHANNFCFSLCIAFLHVQNKWIFILSMNAAMARQWFITPCAHIFKGVKWLLCLSAKISDKLASVEISTLKGLKKGYRRLIYTQSQQVSAGVSRS